MAHGKGDHKLQKWYFKGSLLAWQRKGYMQYCVGITGSLLDNVTSEKSGMVMVKIRFHMAESLITGYSKFERNCTFYLNMLHLP